MGRRAPWWSVFAFALAWTSAAQAFERQGWLDDLAQMQAAFTTKYANLEWAQFDGPVALSELFAQTRDRVNRAESDPEARAAFDQLIRRLGDGHVEVHWPPAHPAEAARSQEPREPCAGYDAAHAARPLMASAPGYARSTPPSRWSLRPAC